jgi:uncharacterized paraquat-inducible protein A
MWQNCELPPHLRGNFDRGKSMETVSASHFSCVIVCPDCATVQRIGLISDGRLDCRTCHATLERATGRSLDAALACSLGALALLIPANLLLMLKDDENVIVAKKKVEIGC